MEDLHGSKCVLEQLAESWPELQLYAGWWASGLGFLLNHLEEAIGNFFNLKDQPEEYLSFDTDVLLRSARKDRIEWLARAVQNGILSPNEARSFEDFPAVEYGDMPRTQAQNLPSSAAAMIPAAPAAAAGVSGKNFQGEVTRVVEGMQARLHTVSATATRHAPSARNGAGGHGPVIREAKANGHDRAAARHGEQSMQQITKMHRREGNGA